MSPIWLLDRQRNLLNGRLAQNLCLVLFPLVPKTEAYRVGETIIRQGDTDGGFYVLEKGSVEVVKDDIVLNVLMFPGTIFGEVSALTGKPRISTVKARTVTTVTRYDGVNLPDFVSEHPELAAKMLETLATRLERTTQKLADIL